MGRVIELPTRDMGPRQSTPPTDADSRDAARSTVVHIGRCLGCDTMAELDDGVCEYCLTAPHRGRKWANLSHRCRTDPAFHRAVYEYATDPAVRETFVRLYGPPEALLRPVEPVTPGTPLLPGPTVDCDSRE